MSGNPSAPVTGLVGMARNTGIDLAGGAAVCIHSRHRRGCAGSGVAKMIYKTKQ